VTATDKTRKGFTTMPRTMALIINVIDNISKQRPSRCRHLLQCAGPARRPMTTAAAGEHWHAGGRDESRHHHQRAAGDRRPSRRSRPAAAVRSGRRLPRPSDHGAWQSLVSGSVCRPVPARSGRRSRPASARTSRGAGGLTSPCFARPMSCGPSSRGASTTVLASARRDRNGPADAPVFRVTRVPHPNFVMVPVRLRRIQIHPHVRT